MMNFTNADEADLPKNSFLECSNIGLYPIVDNTNMLKIIAETGISTAQLRIKDKNISVIEAELIRGIKIAEKSKIRLFINDYWELAIQNQAYGVHLGQEDLLNADIQQIKKSRLRLGISTHSYKELEIALEYNPSYIALGPIFPTKTKDMPWAPQGITKILEWKNKINCPLVVIGGINLDNIDDVLKTGQKNIALISAITMANSPIDATKKFLEKIANA